MVVDGRPAVVFIDNYDAAVRFCRANDAQGTSWPAPVNVVTGDNDHTWISMALIQGQPATCFTSAYDDGVGRPDYSLRYVRATNAQGSSWGTPVVVDGDGNGATLAEVNGAPAIGYQRDTDPGAAAHFALAYMRAEDAVGASWPSQPLLVDDEGSNNGWSACMAVIGGVPAMAYADHGGLNYRYVESADASGDAWLAPVDVEALVMEGSYWTRLLEVDGQPAFAYVSFSPEHSEHLWYAVRH